jgi:hypothetical protein
MAIGILNEADPNVVARAPVILHARNTFPRSIETIARENGKEGGP